MAKKMAGGAIQCVPRDSTLTHLFFPFNLMEEAKNIDSQNKRIDDLLRRRQEGMFNYSNATKGLLGMGVKIGKAGTGEITVPDSYQPFLDKFNISNLEFEWLVTYIDGTVLRQFEGDKQHSFKDIDLGRIKSVEYVSNFIWQTDMAEKRIIVRLNWETGMFEFTNGFASQEVRAKCCVMPLPGDKKLILFARKRMSSAVGESRNELKEFVSMMDEFFFYNRFILGYQVSSGETMAVIIEPNGDIKMFEN